ncbi:MAG: hypothetical protein ACYDCK_09700, partial [Thermoplasmatota archaeon]
MSQGQSQVTPATRSISVLLALLFVGSAFVGVLVASSTPAAAIVPAGATFSPRVRLSDTAGFGGSGVPAPLRPTGEIDTSDQEEPSVAVDRVHDIIYAEAIPNFCTTVGTSVGCGDRVWRSTDQGQNWVGIDPPFGLITGDGDIAVEQNAGGTVYEANLFLGGSDVWSSSDHGTTWSSYDPSGSHTTANDRQWLAAGSAPGIAYLADQSFVTPTYLCAQDHETMIATSNGGALWGPAANVVETAPHSQCVAGREAVDPSDATGHTVYQAVVGFNADPTSSFTPDGAGEIDLYKGVLDPTTNLMTFTLLPNMPNDAGLPAGCSTDGTGQDVGSNWPSTAVDAAGTPYVMWADSLICGGQAHTDIFYSAFKAGAWLTPVDLTTS